MPAASDDSSTDSFVLDPSRDTRATWTIVLVFTALSLTCAITSDGFLTADALTHYLYAKHALHDPSLLVDVWGRPLVTALYAVPAHLGGRLGVRVTSLVLAVVCGFAAMRMARGNVERPLLALLFTLAQPLVFLNSFAEMTELPFAALAGLAFLAYQSRHWWLAAALVSLLPLTRPEGFEFVALAAVGLLANRKVLPLLLLPLPLLFWNLAGWALYGHAGPWWRWLIDHWPYSSQSTYPSGNLLQFVFFLPAVVSPLVLPATLVGVWCATVRWADEERHERVCRLATAGIPLSILVVHSLLYWLGRMASFGEPRYLLVAAPFWAVLSAKGWEELSFAFRVRRPIRWAVIAALVPAAALLAHPVLPLRRPAHWEVAERFATEYREHMVSAGYTRILAAHPAVFYFLDLSPADHDRVVEWRRDLMRHPPPGTVLVWDPIYSARNANTDRALTPDEIRAAGWVQVPEFDAILSGPTTPSNRPTPDPEDQLGPQGHWAVFVHPPGTP